MSKLVKNGSVENRKRMNRAALSVGLISMVAGIVCFIMKAVTPTYLDAQEILHEQFFWLPIGCMLEAAGIVVVLTAILSYGIKALRKN